MVSQETQSNNRKPTSSNSLHHFLVSNHLPTQTHFQNPHFDPNPYADHNQSIDNTHFSTIQSLGERMSRSINLVHNPSLISADDQSEMAHTTRHFMDLLGAPNESNHGPNMLSLSLGSEFIHQAYNNMVNSSCEENCNPSDYSFMGSSSFPVFAVGNSLYLKPAQSVLEEVISLGSKNVDLSEVKTLFVSGRGICNELRTELLSSGYLSSDKHDLQFKLSKLLALLEQVEGRYDEYCHRMDELVSSFEVIAGEGAAKCYTALALQAMCRHFCHLRDAIIFQIKSVRKKLSPELPKLGTEQSHLSLLSQEGQTNNGRLTLQQIGLIQGTQRQAWRPIRGLPETSVAILRAWLFEHFLNPYPNDSEKLTLASQTGLSKNQVSNWFINARVRLWKPMIEEMYKDEFGDSSVDSSGDGVTDHAED